MGAPVFASNYVNLGLQAGLTRHDAIDTNVTRDAAYLASGFTWGAGAPPISLGQTSAA
jgi:hypothetical protein